MKKAMMTLVAAIGLSAFAGTTYHSLSWKVAGTDVVKFDAKYVNVFAEADGVRVGEDARASFGNTDVDYTLSSLVQGEGGWDWSDADIASAEFGVELLSAEGGVIARTASLVPYATLLSANAFEVNGESSFVPVNGTTPYAFTDFDVTAEDGGVYAALVASFGANATVVPQVDADGNYVNYLVTLKNDIAGPVQLKGNLGKVTLDLNGHKITGQDAENGSGEQGGNAIEIAGLLNPGSTATDLTIVNGSATGYAGSVTGGKGADGKQGLKGGYAVWADEALSGVKVTAEGVTVKGGASGNSTTAPRTDGIAAVSSNITATGVTEGDMGTGAFEWAWCVCTFDGDLPDGVMQDGDCLRFFKADKFEQATFNFGVLKDQEIQDRTIHFVDGDIYVDQLKVPESAGDLVFAGGTDTRILAHPFGSAFEVVSSEGQSRAWTNLTFTCGEGVTAFFAGNGGAINAVSGRVDIVDCAFTGCGAGQLGGAVYAAFLSETSSVVRTRFEGNGNEALNFQGGAIYATASKVDVSLVIDACSFVGNTAGNGGAISTETTYDADEKPVALVITDSVFEDNVATYAGGAIYGEGDVLVDAEATRDNPGSTLFARNFASYEGGAIRLDGYEGTQPVAVGLGRGVRFIENVVSNDTTAAQGGAIDIEIAGSVFAAEGVEFRGNAAYGDATAGVTGGAICNNLVDLASFTVDTCVFASNAVVAVTGDYYIYGAAIEIEGDGAVLLKNSTFRHQNYEAVAIAGFNEPTVGVTNCVAVGNGTLFEAQLDLYFVGVNVDMAYTAYGAVDATFAPSFAETNDLAGRKETIYEDEASLRLSPIGFNPVAALGLPQPGVYDFDGVEYGSKAKGSSMGAYETPTAPVVVNLDGSRIYDGTMESNGCAWTWTLWATNGEPLNVSETLADLDPAGGLESLFTIMSWTYGNDDAGYYASSNAAPANITATFSGADDEIQRWIDLEVITFAETGTIGRRPVEMGGLEIVLDPDEYRWTGDRVLANVTVTDTKPAVSEILVDEDDYSLAFSNNVNPTEDANVKVTLLRNYEGVTNLLYAITAYLVEYKYDDVTDESQTKTIGETSGVWGVAGTIPAAPEGYAYDPYYSILSGVVTKVSSPSILRLEVKYWTDSNKDGVPDIYQKKMIAKVANGEWNGLGNGRDQVVWTTLLNADGIWAKDGSGRFGVVSETAATTLPNGGSARIGWFDGGWLAFGSNGKLYYVGDSLAEFDVSADTIPFVLYGYVNEDPNATSARSGRGGFGGRTGSTTPVEAKTAEQQLAEQYSAEVKVVDATLKGDKMTLKTKALVRDAQTGGSIDVELSNARIKVYACKALGDDWAETSATVGEDDTVTIDAKGSAGFFKIGL